MRPLKLFTPEGEPTLSGFLGIPPERKNKLEFLVQTLLAKDDGRYIKEINEMRRYCDPVNEENEYAYIMANYFINVGVNIGIAQTMVKNRN